MCVCVSVCVCVCVCVSQREREREGGGGGRHTYFIIKRQSGNRFFESHCESKQKTDANHTATLICLALKSVFVVVIYPY